MGLVSHTRAHHHSLSGMHELSELQVHAKTRQSDGQTEDPEQEHQAGRTE